MAAVPMARRCQHPEQLHADFRSVRGDKFIAVERGLAIVLAASNEDGGIGSSRNRQATRASGLLWM